MSRVIWVLFCSIILFSCSSQEIFVKKDGAADVKIHLLRVDNELKSDSILEQNGIEKDEVITIDHIKDYYESDLIDNLRIVTNEDHSIETTFSISNIDSLGNYLDPIFGTSAIIRHSSNSFIMKGSNGKANEFEDVCGCTNLLTYNLELKFEQPIKELITQNDYVNKVNENTISISTSIGAMNFYGDSNQFEVKF